MVFVLNQEWVKSQITIGSLFSSSSSWAPRTGNPLTAGLSGSTLQPVLSCLMQDSLLSPYNVSFLSLHNRQSAGGVSKGITGAGTQRSQCKQKEG